MKVEILDKILLRKSLDTLIICLGIVATFISFLNISWTVKGILLTIVAVLGVINHFRLWKSANKLNSIQLKINNSDLIIEFGDIFQEVENKVIPFNEYFDTSFENRLISETSLHGQYLKRIGEEEIELLNQEIELIPKNKIVEECVKRISGKETKFELGTILLREKFFLLSFSHFDDSNVAVLSSNEYVRCLLNMWSEINKIYNGESICVPILGSGMTRMTDNTVITDFELLKIMIWTFRISKVKFTYPSKVKFIILPDKKDKINLFQIKEGN